MTPKTTNGIGLAAVAVLAVCLAFELQHQSRLRQEHQDLEQQSDVMSRIIADNQQLSIRLAQANSPPSLTDDDSRELLRLRGQVGLLRRQSKELETAREENRQARAALESALQGRGAGPKQAATADYWPHDSWTFKGYSSADAALQSFLWAADNGDMKALLAGATGEMREMMEGDLKNKSETEVGIRMMDEVVNMKSVRVINREVRDDDTVVITAQADGLKDDDIEKLVMKKIGNEWKLFGPAKE